MKKILLSLLVFLIAATVLQAQSTYNQELEKAANTITQKIITSGKKSVAVLDFENSNKVNSELGSWLASVFTTHLENSSNNLFVVKNRTDIEKAIQQIKSESGSGAFDSKTIQRLGEISGSDVIIYGEITLMDNEITVNIRTKNISLNATIGGVLVSFPATEGMKTKYDNYLETKPVAGTITNPAGGTSGEGTPRTYKNPNCREKNVGDYCFQNSTKVDLYVQFHPAAAPGAYSGYQRCTLQPGQQQCFYDIYYGPATYTITNPANSYSQSPDSHNSEGTLYVETCKEKIFIIK